MQELERKIGYRFRDWRLLETALTHSSYANERRDEGCESYERLEFLGDSILGHVTADFLYRQEPTIPEGRMTRLRAELVCEASLHRIAQRLDLGRYMRLGKGEERTRGRERPSILADMVESLIAAMYLDSGSLEQSRRFILDQLLLQADL
jgi:ribonuclease-3